MPILSSEASSCHSFHPKNLVRSSLALSFWPSAPRLSCACFGECFELHLRLEPPYERGLLLTATLVLATAFSASGDAGDEPVHTLCLSF